MKTKCFLLILCVALSDASAQTINSWIATTDASWLVPANWSLSRLPTNSDSIFITNASASKSVFVDSAAPVTSLTISNLTVSTPFGSNTVLLVRATTNLPLRVLNTLKLLPGGALSITNGAVEVFFGGTALNFVDDGKILLYSSSARLVATTQVVHVGFNLQGTLTVSNGTVLAKSLFLGTQSNSGGTLTVAGGVCQLNSGTLSLGEIVSSSGTVWVTGGRLDAPSTSPSVIGHLGKGRMTVSNGTVSVGALTVGGSGSGTLTLAGGTNSVSLLLSVGGGTTGTGTVWMTGGQLFTTNSTGGTAFIGGGGIGVMTMSNGTWLGRVTHVGSSHGTITSTLTMTGGTNVISSVLSVAEATNDVGALFLTGTGRLVVTNGTTLIGARGHGSMTMSNGTFLGGAVRLGTNANAYGEFNMFGGLAAVTGPFQCGVTGNGAVVLTTGLLAITNTPATVTGGSGLVVDGTLTIGSNGFVSCLFLPTIIGNVGNGSVTALGGGGMVVSNLVVGNLAGSVGTLTFAGGTNFLYGAMTIGSSANATGTVWLTRGGLTTANQTLSAIIGNSGVGQMTVSNGIWSSAGVVVSYLNGSQGTLTMAGGTNTLGYLLLAAPLNGHAEVWMSGGQLTVTNDLLGIGGNSVGSMVVSGGTLRARVAVVGYGANSQGSLTIAGGTSSVYSNLTIGLTPCASTGIVTVAGGSLFVTNTTGTAVLEVRTGTLQLNSGTLTLDKLVITNACGHFIRTGGTLFSTTTNISANLDADGDGLPNSWETGFGLDPFADSSAADPDGDGFTNLQEFQAGTNPTNSSSLFGISGLAAEGSDLRVTWMTAPGKTNALERAAGAAGSFSNTFAAIFTVTNTTSTVTNYLDIGAATNVPAFYYRIRLVP